MLDDVATATINQGSQAKADYEGKAYGYSLTNGVVNDDPVTVKLRYTNFKDVLGRLTVWQENVPQAGSIYAGAIEVTASGSDPLYKSKSFVESVNYDNTVVSASYHEEAYNKSSFYNATEWGLTIPAGSGFSSPDLDYLQYQDKSTSWTPNFGWTTQGFKIVIWYTALMVAQGVRFEMNLHRDLNLVNNVRLFRIRWRQTLLAASGAIALSYLGLPVLPAPGIPGPDSLLAKEETPEPEGFEVI